MNVYLTVECNFQMSNTKIWCSRSVNGMRSAKGLVDGSMKNNSFTHTAMNTFTS